MTNITIPTVALEAAARAMWRTDEPSQWELGMADIALRAGINAWPGMLIRPSVPDGVWHSYDCSRARIILPLPEKGES